MIVPATSSAHPTRTAHRLTAHAESYRSTVLVNGGILRIGNGVFSPSATNGIVVATGAKDHPGELVALTLP